MIEIKQSQTADTRTCDVSKVTKETLLASSEQHINDVRQGLEFFSNKLSEAAKSHDFDKITEIDWFHNDFKTGFAETGWWDNHRRVNRHHIDKADGVPEDVNLIDVMEHITDCVMAGMGRRGDVFPINLDNDLLQKAITNTVNMLKNNVKVTNN